MYTAIIYWSLAKAACPRVASDFNYSFSHFYKIALSSTGRTNRITTSQGKFVLAVITYLKFYADPISLYVTLCNQ